jgi:hypothetical protein
MDTSQRPPKRDRIISLFKRKVQTQPPSTQTSSSNSIVPCPAPKDAKTGDMQRTRARYLAAAKLLEEAVKAYEGRWGSFDFPELKGEPEDFDDSLFREKINIVMDAQKNGVNDQTAWAKCGHALQCAFTAFSPFAKHFLSIAKEVQALFATPSLSHL